MKPRIKTDTTILIVIILCTGIFAAFKKLYLSNEIFDALFDAMGFLLIYKGNFLRMAARGHKKNFSKQSHALVVSGPYTIVRNPMYLGTFYLGAGFAFLVWPFWSVPIFACFFYLRFIKQIKIEEAFLLKSFGKEYENYCAKVPRLIPRLDIVTKINFKKTFDLNSVFSTKETRGLIFWPLLAMILESIQQIFVFGNVDLLGSLTTYFATTTIFFVGLAVYYSEGKQ